MDTASAMVVFAGCAVLTWSGLEKVRHLSPLVSTLAGLGVAPRLVVSIAAAVPLVELGTVATVVAGAPRYISGGLLVALGTSFAAAAAWSLASDRVVPCACFGAAGGRLGWWQIGALPLWLLVGWATLHLPGSTLRERVGLLACGLLVLAAARAVPVLQGAAEARADRRALVGG